MGTLGATSGTGVEVSGREEVGVLRAGAPVLTAPQACDAVRMVLGAAVRDLSLWAWEFDSGWLVAASGPVEGGSGLPRGTTRAASAGRDGPDGDGEPRLPLNVLEPQADEIGPLWAVDGVDGSVRTVDPRRPLGPVTCRYADFKARVAPLERAG